MQHRQPTRARLLSVVAAGLLVAACGGTTAADRAPSTLAQGPTVSAQAEPAGMDEADADDSDDGTTGIHVAGDWEVVVRDPDGTVVSETRFHNDLTPSGARSLGIMLHAGGGGGSTDAMPIVIPGDPGLCSFPEDIGCVIEPNRGVDYSTGRITLSSAVDAVEDGSFQTVQTYLNQGATLFTERELDEPITYVEDQQVTIRVELTFS